MKLNQSIIFNKIVLLNMSAFLFHSVCSVDRSLFECMSVRPSVSPSVVPSVCPSAVMGKIIIKSILKIQNKILFKSIFKMLLHNTFSKHFENTFTYFSKVFCFVFAK